MNLAGHFTRFFAAHPKGLHFAAHSHHPWPDATESAHARYWSDSAARVDLKWQGIFGEAVPRAQGHVARLLHLPDARQVAFAPNTHEFVSRLYSCLDWTRPVQVLAGGHEFHSFRRQTRRLQETGQLRLTEVPGEPFATFPQRFVEAARSRAWDLVWISEVFFDTGFHVEGLEAIVDAVPEGPIVAIDGYHAFCALPVDLARIHRRAFYLAGGYKYAMSGEGACFLAVPPGCDLRPVDTGWFATFGALEAAQGDAVAYSADAFRFWGSTFDASGLYRFNAAMDWLESTGVTIAQIHRHALTLQERFLAGLERIATPRLPADRLVPAPAHPRGNFLAFDLDEAERVHERLLQEGIYVDRRDRRLRFGFGVYHEAGSVDRLLEALEAALR